MVKEGDEEEFTEEEATVEEADASLDTSSVQSSSSNGVAEVELGGPSVTLPPCHLEDPLESPIAQPEELRLPNGLPLPAARDPEASAINTSERDDSPIAEPDVSQQPDMLTSVTEVPTLKVTASAVPTDQSAPADIVEEVHVKEAVQAEPAQPGAQDTVHSTVLDDKENAPELQPNTREETSSPAEPVPTADNVPETMPASPPPAAEEKEDTPSTQTVTPTLVETIMQGQCRSDVWKLIFCYLDKFLLFKIFFNRMVLVRCECSDLRLIVIYSVAAVSVPKKKRKMKDLNKKEAVGDLLDAFKEVRLQ